MTLKVTLVVAVLLICVVGVASAQESSSNGISTHELMGWGTLALINAGLAQIKNKISESPGLGGLAWFFITLFIGPIATFLIVVVKE